VIGVAVIVLLVLISFELGYLRETSSSTQNSTNTSGSSTQTASSTYESPKQVCASLPATALGNVTSNSNASNVYVLIVEGDIGSSYEGINGSAHHQDTNWPVITVYQGQSITVHVVNCPSSPEPHGFAIGHYFNSGVSLSPGQSYTFTFVADATGRFTVFCDIFCAIHQYMQNGELLVKPMPSS
ncbi:MAG: hypothetical protein JRN67_11495, partial [Nitrososphaerota archaeon]|nr:hypothetical protein [Nitrososphaerota archaeon]